MYKWNLEIYIVRLIIVILIIIIIVWNVNGRSYLALGLVHEQAVNKTGLVLAAILRTGRLC